MPYTFSATYMACQTCKSKIHCGECETRLEETMMRLNGVHGASLQMAKKELLIDAEQGEEDLMDARWRIWVFSQINIPPGGLWHHRKNGKIIAAQKERERNGRLS